MHVHFEQNTCTRTDSNFLSLSWMGKVPEDLPEEGGGWKLNRAQYYVEGWLASGNARGVVGVTFSTSHCHKYDAPPRSNFNLRGHRSEVVLVRWNEPYQKLATCDSRGVIFVWIKHEGRWSIELINDRNSQVTDFAWSHDGRMALICYRDGFILVGSVAGQRYWSSMLNLDNTSITCGVWSPDDQQVMFGTLDGQIIVMSSTGTVVTQVAIHEGFEITSMAWSCERFNMEEAETAREGGDHSTKASDNSPKSHVLAVCFKYGDIFLMSGYDDICPIMVYTTLTGVKIDWSNCGEYLAVAGFVRLPNLQCRNEVHFYSKDGSLIHWVNIPSQGKPLTAMTWGHNDKRLFLAAGCHLYVAWVSKQVAPLQFLCQRVVHQAVRTEKAVEKLPIPQRLRCGVKALFSPTIKSYIPDPLRLREFVCSPPPGGERLFCTMIRHGEETSGGHYTLYLEYLGGLVPLLKGKRASKLRPDFIIYDPKIKSSGKEPPQPGGAIESDTSSESDTDVYTDGCGSPRMQRRRRNKVFRAEKVNRSITFRTLDELMYDDNLPETNRLVEVTSNIWGTKFQITGVASSLPACLGQVVYKTSLLHLQPRQMTITITEIIPSRQVLSRDPNFTPAPVSDDEDSFWTSEGDLAGEKKTVEVTVHDTPPLFAEDVNNKGDRSPSDGGRRLTSVDSPLIEHRVPLNGDLSSLAGKLGGSGTVRSRSLSPVRNSLTQTVPAFKQDDTRQESNNSSGWQGARPKAHANKRSNSSVNYNSSSNIPNSSPKLSAVNNNKCAALPNNTYPTSHPTSQYANANGVLTHTSTASANKVEAYPLSAPTISGCKKLESLPGFKRVDAVGGSEKGSVGGSGGVDIVSVGGMWRNEEPSSPSFQSALTQLDSGSSSSSAQDIVSPLVDTGRGVGPRWADPAIQAVKLLEEGMAEISDLPFENNLVADCSPTAPHCLDLHRRLYLAQHNIVDTGAPISPSSCPACLPTQCALGAEPCSNTTCIITPANSDIVAQHNMKNASTSRQRESSDSGARDKGKQPQKQMPSDSSVCSTNITSETPDLNSRHEELSALTNTGQPAGQGDQPHISFTICSNCKLKQISTSDKSTSTRHASSQTSLDLLSKHDDILPLSVETDSTSHPNSVFHPLVLQTEGEGEGNQVKAATQKPQQPQTPKESSSQISPPKNQPTPTQQSSDSHALQSLSSLPHSTLPTGLSSFDKLNLILSEDPANQNSVHNFRSMPGFIMKNPDLKEDDDDSSSPDRDISEASDDQLAMAYTCHDELPGNNIQDIEVHQTSASLPSSPLRFGAKQDLNSQQLQEELLKGRCKHLSPLMGRKGRDSPMLSSQDVYLGMDDFRFSQQYQNLEAFQKAQLRQKMRRRLNSASGRLEQARTFTMHNKAPLWNETSQVYQLDFGGRVTQESAKNFQIELRGKQVMQFGRIDNNAYTLDFQYPFTAIQAFAVALANVTQRLK